MKILFILLDWFSLIASNGLIKFLLSIVVGISTIDRRRDFIFPTTIQEDKQRFPTTGGSDKFISFIQNELQPFIDAKFKTTKDRTTIG